MPTPRLNPKQTALLVVDVQERLVPAMNEPQRLTNAVIKLIDGSNVLGVPTLVTEQYRKGLGVTISEIAKRLEGVVCNQEKLKFSACVEPVLNQLKMLGVRNVIVCGIEAHVCVLQTCLDLLDAGFITALAVDAITSRRVVDQETAVARMVQAGVLPVTVESLLLELVREAGTDAFKAILPLIK